ncbi:MAG: hypothetical protein E7256_09895 [Lachnospiraceae bacterium]|nr:hypothetical protein [Lachnospiraceae bacterium]
MPSKKIVLFIVEGITDQLSLAAVLEQIFAGNQVSFQITNGDITTRANQSAKNITAKVGKVVKDFCGNIFSAKDFLKIIHLVDTDGAFIGEDHVEQSDNRHPFYLDTCIQTSNVKGIIERNEQKAENLEKLVGVKTVMQTIPYSVYYFSSNLEHVLHNKRNLQTQEKDELAMKFEQRFLRDINAFVQEMTESEIAVKGDYEETWEFIKKEENSLKRYTNFGLCLKENKDKDCNEENELL